MFTSLDLNAFTLFATEPASVTMAVVGGLCLFTYELARRRALKNMPASLKVAIQRTARHDPLLSGEPAMGEMAQAGVLIAENMDAMTPSHKSQLAA